MTIQRTVFIDTNLNDFEALAGRYDASAYTVVRVSGGYQAIQDYLTSNAISADDVNVVSASGSQNGVFNPRVVFVDPGVANYQQLIADMPANATIVVLDATRDGVQQIHDYLAANTGLVEAIDIVADIASLDVVSHGGAGEITLGSTVLSSANLADYEAELSAIGDMLSESGDILIYGCDVAAGAEGQQFIQELAAVTGADVAASTDLTGSASAGGDWELEASTGTIETAVISDPAYGEVLVNSSITGISTTSIATDTGSSPTDFITRDTTITFVGSVTASVGSSPQSFYVWLVPQTGTALCLNPSLAIASTAGSTTSWNLSYAPALVQGNYTIKFSTSNNISNYESKLLGTERSLTIDTGTAAPSVALTNDTGSSNSDKITSDGSLTITDQEAGATLSYSVNGGTSFTSSFTAVDGVNTVIVRSTDVAGNFADTTFNFTLDTIVDASTNAAIVELSNDSGSDGGDNITRLGTLSISGQEEGATISYSLNGGGFISSFTAVEGVNNVIVRSTDGVGNFADTPFSFTLDTLTPAPVVALTTDSGSDTGDEITNVGTLAITGQEAGATTSYSVDGGSTFTNSFSATEGANSVIVRSTDVAGNTADTAFSFTLDTDADLSDNLAVTINDGDGFINNAEKTAVSFTVAGLDADAKATVTFTDSANTTVVVSNLDNGTMLADLSGLLDGPITASISALDIAGNEASGTGDSSTKDTTTPAPVVALTTDSGSDTGDEITNVGTLAITGQEAGATTSYSVDGGSTFTNSFSATEGANSVIVRSTDVAGNTADTAFSFTLDTDADLSDNLAVTINDGDGFINNAEKAAVSFTVAGLDADAKATVTFTDSASNTVVVSDLSNGATTADLSGLLDGPITASISALDIAGNEASGIGDSSTKDTTTPAPVVALTTDSGSDTGDEITNVGTLAITGQEAGATTSYSVDGGSTFTNSFSATEGANSVIVRSTDVAGNTADTAFSFTLDTDADLSDNLAVTINDGDGFINNAEKAAVSFTVAGLDADAKATVTFTDSASNTVVVSDLSNGATTADLSGLLDGPITASISALDIAGNEASGTGDSSTKDTIAPNASAIPLAVVENAPILLPLVQDWLIDNINQSQIQIGTIQYAWASGSSSTALIDPVSKQPVALSTLGGKVTWSSDGKSLLIQTDAKLDWMTSGQQITATIHYTVQDGAGNTTTQPIILNIMGSSTDGKDKVLNGTNGVDKWTGADGSDYGQGGNGNDILSGMAGNDALYGGNGNDDINAGTGTDYLYGDSGNDTVRGGDGNDVIFGGMNNDTLYGDAGNDHFVYMPKFNNDKIMDFVKGTDTLHLIGLTPQGMTASQFVANHVQDVGNDLLISIGGNTITLVGVADTSGLAASVSFVMPQ